VKRLALEIALGLGLVLGVATARQFTIGAQAIEASDRAMQQGDVLSALDEARFAAQARAIGSPYPERGYQRLEEIAQTSEARHDVVTAARAWRAIRAASTSTRVFGRAADDDRVRMADSALTRLADLDPARGERPHPDAALGTDDRPAPSTYAIYGAGGLLLYAGLVLLLRRRSAA
jgi:hypothetical protein